MLRSLTGAFMHPHLTLRAKVFYLIRRHDIELAETFARRCPEVRDVMELNTFFHHMFSQIENCPVQARQCLNDTMSVDDWLRNFEHDALPVLLRRRFPPFTAKNVPAFYDRHVSGFAPA